MSAVCSYCGTGTYSGTHICKGTALESEYKRLKKEHDELLKASAELTKTYKEALDLEAAIEPPLHVGFIERAQIDKWLAGGVKPIVHAHHYEAGSIYRSSDVSDDPMHADCEPIYVFR